jgi:hypothetical protein
VIVVGVAASGCDVGQRRGKEKADVMKMGAPRLDGIVRVAVEVPKAGVEERPAGFFKKNREKCRA